MKKLLLLSLLFPVFTVSASDDKKEERNFQQKTKLTQSKITSGYANWHVAERDDDDDDDDDDDKRRYSRASHSKNSSNLFKCRNAEGYLLRGKYSREQQYFIQLGGGQCYRGRSHKRRYGVLTPITQYDFAISNVRHAIKRIKRDFGLHNAHVVETDDINAGFKTLKYTLVFKIPGRKYREFRVDHRRHNGRIRSINEV